MSKSANVRIARNTFFLYVRMFFILAISLYTSRVIIDALGIIDYGIYGVIAGFVSLFTFLNSSMSSATQRFLSFEIGRQSQIRLGKMFSGSLVIYICIAVIIAIFFETIGLWFLYNKISISQNRLTSAVWVFHFSVLTIMIQTMQIPFNALIIAREKMNIYAFLSFIEAALKLGIVYVLLVLNVDKLILYSILMFIVTLSIAMFYISYCFLRFSESRFNQYPDKVIYKELIAYSSWNLFGNIAAVAKGQGINVILNIFFGPIVNAAYAIMIQVQSAVNLFSNNFLLAVNPQVIKSYSVNDIERYQMLIKKGARFSFLLISILVLPIIYNIDFILFFWLKTVPDYTSIFIILCLICLQIDSISGTLMSGIQATGKIKLYQIVVGGILFLNLPISYVFLNMNYPPYVVFFVAIILAIISLFFRLFFLEKLELLKMKLFIRDVLLRSVITIILMNLMLLFVLSKVYFSSENLIHNFSRIILCFLLSIIIAFLFGLEKQEKLFLFHSIKSKFKKIYEKSH